MTSETNYEKAGYYLEYLQSLCLDLEKLAKTVGLDFQWMINRLCNFSYDSYFSNSRKDFQINENWAQLLSVYHNLLCRGVPTYPTANIEKLLFSELSKEFHIEELADERKIAFRDQMISAQREKWLTVLVKAHSVIDYRCEEFRDNTESDEEETFLKYVSDNVNASVFQTIECQRPISTMIATSDKEEFQDQRVDFSLETRDNRIVIEIDGEQHQEEKQQRLDRQRQKYLEKNNWTLYRIPAWKIRQKQFNDVVEVLKKSYSNDPFLVAAKGSFDRPINTDQIGQAALQLVLTPIAIARIQWVLIWAFMKGKLSFDQPTIRIAIIEGDVPCAFLALWDFIQTLNHLKSIAGTETPTPKV